MNEMHTYLIVSILDRIFHALLINYLLWIRNVFYNNIAEIEAIDALVADAFMNKFNIV